jgi:hypothetical protein
MAAITAKAISAAIKRDTGDVVGVYKADAVITFYGDGLEYWPSQTVYVYALNHLSIAQWVEEYRDLKNEYLKHKEEYP